VSDNFQFKNAAVEVTRGRKLDENDGDVSRVFTYLQTPIDRLSVRLHYFD